MAKNMKYENALHISVDAPYDVKSGAPVSVGLIRGVALIDAAKNERVTVWLDGSWELELSAAIDAGDPVYISSAGKLQKTGGDFFGVALETTSGAGPVEVAPIGYATPGATGGGSGE